MSQPPFLLQPPRHHEALARRRRRRRAWIAAAVVALVAAAAAAVLLVVKPQHGATPDATAASAGATHLPQSPSGSPTDEGVGPQPLAVKLGPSDLIHLHFKVPPRSALLFDLETGRVLWRRHPDRILPIASLTKMMTALVVVAAEPPQAQVLITRQAINFSGSGVGNLPLHHHLRVESLLAGLLLPSGNDAAIALAQKVAGSQHRFVELMNERAASMNLGCTHYVTPSGIVDAGNHSCAIDLAAEARAVLDSPRLARIVRMSRDVIHAPVKGGKLFLYNNNPLIRDRYPGAIGIKTGYTRAAGLCLVAAVRRDGHVLGLVLLHTPDWLNQAKRIFDAGFRFVRRDPGAA